MSKSLKPITELTAEELLDLISENPKEVSNIEYNNDILEFISLYNIQSGENQILVPLIYELYRKWSKKPLHRNQFGMEMSKFFVSVRYGLGTTYRINKSKEFFLEKSIKKNANKTKKKPWLKHFQNFISKYDLKSGRFYVKDIVLYNLYDRWVYKNNNKRPLNLYQFLKFCRLFFKKPAPKMIKNHEYFSLNEEINEYLTPDLINLMKQK